MIMRARTWGTWMMLTMLAVAILLLAGDDRMACAARSSTRQAGADRAAELDLLPDDASYDGPYELSSDAAPGEVSALTLRADRLVLAPGRHEEWIDRLVLPSWGHDLYLRLIEGSDADGDDDFLIDEAALRPAPETSRLHEYVPGHVVTYKDETYLVIAQVDADAAADALGDAVFAVAGCFEYDHPEVFWLNRTTRYATIGFATEPRHTRFLVLCLSDGDDYDIRDGSYRSQRAIERDIAFRDQCVARLVGEAKKRSTTSDASSVAGLGASVPSRLDTESGTGVASAPDTASTRSAALESSPTSDMGSAMSANASTFEQIRFFNEWLAQANDYNIDMSRCELAPSDAVYRSITALKGRIGAEGPVCDGYAKAFKVLCDAAGIPCVFVRGLADPDDPASRHGWNEVRLDGQWYAVDVTWDDPVGSGMQPAKSGREHEQYLLVGSKTVDAAGRAFESHHVETNEFFGEGSTRLLNGPRLAERAYQAPGREVVAVYRLWNPYTGEHLFTTSSAEYRKLPKSGWRAEGVAFYGLQSEGALRDAGVHAADGTQAADDPRAPDGLRAAGMPVYRLANPFNGDHHYTTDRAECEALARIGWLPEGIAWHAESRRCIPIYRLFNPHDPGPGAHHLTTDANECRSLARNGWLYEGIDSYAALY